VPDTPVTAEAARRYPAETGLDSLEVHVTQGALRTARRRDFVQGAVWADEQRAARVPQQQVDALLAEARSMVNISKIGDGARGVINDLANALREISKPST
jgi:hypothetical protein